MEEYLTKHIVKLLQDKTKEMVQIELMMILEETDIKLVLKMISNMQNI